MAKGYFTLVLHAHLPFVRHPEYERFLEENWLFEAISETYLPLLRVFNRLKNDNIGFRITMSISPTLGSMLSDELLQSRYVKHISRLIELTEKEIKRTENEPEFNKLARMYHEIFTRNYQDFTGLYQNNILKGFKEFQDAGYLELITSSATHCFLPNIEKYPQNIDAQIRVAVMTHNDFFGTDPKGIWLPECGYFPGLENHLKKSNLNFFFLDTHGILFAERKPAFGIYAPVCCNNLVAAFGREPSSSWAVWSADDGYPGDYVYREYYRDAGYDLPIDYIRPYIHEGDLRIDTGVKYYAITGDTDQKKPYDREKALEKVKEHADNFVYKRCERILKLESMMDRQPVIVSPFDAELFGHWWFEGPDWIEALVRRLDREKETIVMATPTDYLSQQKSSQISTPCFSSWGNNGYGEVWLEESNDWIYEHIHKAIDRMIELIGKFPSAEGMIERALNQAARELLLAESSDWAFIMKTGTTTPYAVKRTREHIHNFNKLYNSVLKGSVDEEWLSKVEKKNNIFPRISYKVFA